MNEELIYKNMNRFEENLSPYATKNSEALRFIEEKEDIRSPFFRDIDRIIYSLSYTRYIDKTQVFTFNEDDHISKRMTHVQMVSKIGRTIGRALGLNEDLIEAAALGHDLGHVPFGHVGESILNKISLEVDEGYFNHNIQSVRTLMYLENKGKGRNLTLQTLDAIMCHNGEFLMECYKPIKKDWNKFFQEYNNSYTKKEIVKYLVPMTLEGCVVRISDIIAYIGKDIEDALRLGVIKRKDLPKDIIEVLGDENSTIVNTIILDVIENSINKPYLKMSSNIYSMVNQLKKYNYANIYLKANDKNSLDNYEEMIRVVFNHSLKSLYNEDTKSAIWQNYLKDLREDYINNTTKERIVLDYISGMTDDFLKRQYDKIKEL